ncbi:hypothetical protein L6452_42292 [Arctium lappa]|uniref:Uncharacterized protein n=2 Tax=Arctium lappa TaxID=4217 RepID=A0ACB8XHA6_ARCLA|nr:hypothetical protein L6452_42291 [Arctium lappa]KAI3667243.1 hypothetical protein L6452_42292 [Arctium lappa]
MMVLNASIDQRRRFEPATGERLTATNNSTIKKKPLTTVLGWSFGLKTLAVMVLFTVSLVVLPLVLPPLPPPPPLLLFVPVLIMSVLLFLAFAPSKLPPDAVVYCG